MQQAKPHRITTSEMLNECTQQALLQAFVHSGLEPTLGQACTAEQMGKVEFVDIVAIGKPEGKCTKLHTVAASNNRDHLDKIYYCLFSHIYMGAILAVPYFLPNKPNRQISRGQFLALKMSFFHITAQ